jgi:hypothetical protein
LVGTIGAAVAGVIGGATATVALTPQLRERREVDPAFRVPILGMFERGLLLAVSLVAIAVVVWLVFSDNPSSTLRICGIEVAVVTFGSGVLAGLGFRTVTATSDGANFGAGLVVLGSPIVVVKLVRYLASRVRFIRSLDSTGDVNGRQVS